MMLQTDAVLDKAQELKAQGTPFVLATVVRAESPTSAKPGAKGLVTAEGELIGWVGGGCAQPAVLDTAKKALGDGQPRLIRVSPNKGAAVEEGIIDFGMTCHSGGTLDIFIDPVIARPALLILGASPVARTLCVLAHHTGFAVKVAFPGASAEQFPDAQETIDGMDLAQLAGGAPALLVVATQGKRDEAGLEAALKLGAPYVAFVASARKADKLKAYLKERGHDPARVDAIISPAGIEIGAVTPEEIAVSVLAGLIAARRGAARAGAAESTSETAVSSSACCAGSDPADTAIDPVCGMTVKVADAEHVSSHQGSDYYFCCAGCRHAFDKDPLKYLEAKETS